MQNLFNEIFPFYQFDGICNYIIGREYFFIIFIGIPFHHPIISEIGKFKEDMNFKVEYAFKYSNNNNISTEFMKYLNERDLDALIESFNSEKIQKNQYITIDNNEIYYYKIGKSKSISKDNKFNSINSSKTKNIFKNSITFQNNNCLYRMLSLYCNNSLLGKKIGNNEYNFKDCCIIDHQFLQNIKINFNYKMLKEKLDSNNSTQNILNEATNENSVTINNIIKVLPNPIKEKYKTLDFFSFKNSTNFQFNTIPKQIENDIIYYVDNFEIIDNVTFQLFCKNPELMKNKEVEAKYVYINEKIIINLPEYLNEKKFVTVIGNMDYDSRKIEINYIFVYKSKDEQKIHLNNITPDIINYLGNIKQDISKIVFQGKEIGSICKIEEFIIPPPLEDDKKSYKIIKIGLQNIGATCYMNATLQCFAHIKKFVNFFKNDNHHTSVLSNKETLSYSFKLLFDNLFPEKNNKNNKNYYEPTEFKEKISKMNPLFAGIAANDSKDLINFLVMTLHEELNDTNNIIINSNVIQDQRNKVLMFQEFMEDFVQRYRSIVSNIFYGANCNITQCTQCNTLLYNYQVYFFIIFPLEEVRKYIFTFNNFNNFNRNPNLVDIYECFEFDRRINLMMGENAMYCNFCQASTNSQIKTDLITGPNVLILILNRGKGKEFDVKLSFYEQLNLFNYIERKETGFNYKLIGVITHLGESGMSGHFIAFCRDPDTLLWYKFNDAIVSPVNNFKSEVIDFGMPYLLFYQKMN